MAQMFIRFGDLPAGARSRNDDTGELEAGVSVYRAAWDSPDHDILSVELCSWGDVMQLHALQERPPYLVEGDEVGVGSDGEPVLANVTATLLEGVEAVHYSIDA